MLRVEGRLQPSPQELRREADVAVRDADELVEVQRGEPPRAVVAARGRDAELRQNLQNMVSLWACFFEMRKDEVLPYF